MTTSSTTNDDAVDVERAISATAPNDSGSKGTSTGSRLTVSWLVGGPSSPANAVRRGVSSLVHRAGGTLASVNDAPGGNNLNTNSSTKSISNKSGEDKVFGTSRAVWIGRVVFVASLIVVAAILGFLTHYFLSRSEVSLAEQQFTAVAHRTLDLARQATITKRLGTVSMSQIAAYSNPRAASWPNVYIPAFEAIAAELMALYNTVEYAFLPKVENVGTQQADFEDFAYDYFFNVREPPFPNGTAIYHDPYIRGIVGEQTTLNRTTHNIFHDNGTTRHWDSPYTTMFPILQHDQGPFRFLMFNRHQIPTNGILLDRMMDCAAQRKWKQDLTMDCSAISGFLWRHTSVVFEPIYPAMDPLEFTGSIMTRIRWDDVIADLFATRRGAVDQKVSGVDIVLQFQDVALTYHVNNGQAERAVDDEGKPAVGDFHDDAYTHYGVSDTISGAIPTSTGDAQYVLTLYPNDAFFSVYSTSNPAFAMWGAVAIVIGMSLIFFLYDFYVRREFTAKKDLLSAKRKFVRFVSHEVRTPLNAVFMGLTLLLEELRDAAIVCRNIGGHVSRDRDQDGESAELCSTTDPMNEVQSSDVQRWLGLTNDISINTKSAVDVLNDLLNYDKIQFGSFSLELSVLPIWTLVDECTNEFKLQAKKNGVSLLLDFSALNGSSAVDLTNDDYVNNNDGHRDKTKVPPELRSRKVVGDKIRLAQVVRNLVSNGLKFTKEGGSLTIRVSRVKPSSSASTNKETESTYTLSNGEEVSFVKSGMAQVEVIDTGVGLSQDQLKSMFGDGVQFNVNQLQSGGGSGLGLYISRGIAQQHGGSLEVYSDGIGYGTTFTLQLPLSYVPDLSNEDFNDGNADNGSLTSGTQLQQPTPGSHRPLRVLVVDDVAMNRKLLASLAKRRGHVVVEAVDGQDAIDKVAEALETGVVFDSILMDYEMPVLNGPNSVKRIRELGCTAAFVVGVTGNLLDDDVSYFKASGADTVLAKPVQFDELERLWSLHCCSMVEEGADQGMEAC